jgi:hypothetical protein
MVSYRSIRATVAGKGFSGSGGNVRRLMIDESERPVSAAFIPTGPFIRQRISNGNVTWKK